MKTTRTNMNLELANELLEIRKELKLLEQREKELKEYFSALVDSDGSLKVGTCILISKHQASRTSYDSKSLDAFFKLNNINASEYKKTTTYSTLKIQSIA